MAVREQSEFIPDLTVKTKVNACVITDAPVELPSSGQSKASQRFTRRNGSERGRNTGARRSFFVDRPFFLGPGLKSIV
ncbi:MAG: hypothetical protein WCA21_04160 [Terracidiphilus sp.]